jgi:hypothetical protein
MAESRLSPFALTTAHAGMSAEDDARVESLARVAGGCSTGASGASGRGEVAKRSNAADCKSVALAASEVRILPSPPVFAHVANVGWQAGRGKWRRQVAVRDGGLAPPKSSGGLRRSERDEGGSNSVVESQPSKLLVAGSIPVSRSRLRRAFAALTASSGHAVSGVQSRRADVAQLAERVLGKDEVTGSIPVIGSRLMG